MEPIPETVEAIGELDAFAADEQLLEKLLEMGAEVRRLVPQCTGLSLTAQDPDGATFTLVASRREIAELDAVQYVAGGPCVAAVEEESEMVVDHGLMDERDWRLFAQATAARGILSTLSMPVFRGGKVVHSVNLYASTADAFDGRHEELAAVLGAWPEGAVTNADLAFETREAARRTPQRLRDAATVDVATGLLAARLDVDLEQARSRLENAAVRAGIDLARFAATVVTLLGAA